MIEFKNIQRNKIKYFLLILLLVFIYNCSNKSNDPEFVKNSAGRYLYNSDEVISVYFIENELHMEWRGKKNIKPLKINDTTFFVKEMNEKIYFSVNPSDHQKYMVLVPKEENKIIEYNFRKLGASEKIPSAYLKNNEFDKALEGYLAIKGKDSLDGAIDENTLNELGYQELRENNYEYSINIFRINVALYSNSSNVYDSLGEAYMKKGDTAQAIVNYKKSLELDSGNARAKRLIKKLENKE